MDPRTRGRPSSRVCLLGNNSHYSANTLLAFISVVFSFTQSLSSNVHFLTFVSFRIIAERLPSPTQSSITHRKSKEQGSRSINSLQPWPAKKRQCTSSTWALPWAESATDVTIQTSNGHLIMCGTRSQLRYVSALQLSSTPCQVRLDAEHISQRLNRNDLGLVGRSYTAQNVAKMATLIIGRTESFISHC